ncbi:accessory Sec system S-layer assembly protein [Bacillus sp. MM2020_1]|nr:accessory Sec system S-layer assembly protein [Bacillus sp. MM2020_1]
MELSTLNTEEKLHQDPTVETKLHFTDQWDMSSKDRYVYQYHHRKLPKLQEGQLSISGIKYLDIDGELLVEAFIRNTVPQALTIQEVNLIVLDENDQPVAKKRFSLDQLGERPPFSCTPWRFFFTANDRLSDAAVSDQWKILFELNTKSKEEVLDLEPDWEDSLTEEKKAHLEGLLEKLPKLGPKEVNICGVEIKFLDNQSLEATVLIRNGTSQEVNITQLPLTVDDASGEVVCQGQFKLAPLTIKPKSAKPWTFVYPANLVLNHNPDLSKWRIFVKEYNKEDI